MAYQLPRILKSNFNFNELFLTKPECLTGVSQQSGYKEKLFCTLFFEIRDEVYASYEIGPLFDQHGMECPEIAVGWEGIVIQKTI